MNPELRRLLWLEVSLQRLWLVPAAILGVLFLFDRSGVPPAGMRSFALLLLGACTLVWGARASAQSVSDEIQARTWAIQRMSALGPWRMTWGKLCGATAMPWYAALFCIAAYLGYPAEPGDRATLWLALVLLSAVALQAFALTVTLVRAHREPESGRAMHPFIVLVLLGIVVPDLTGPLLPLVGDLVSFGEIVMWYGRPADGLSFGVVSTGILAAWAIVGAYRMMCLALAVRTTPWVWLAFIGYLAVLMTGMQNPWGSNALPMLASNATLVACALAYLVAFTFSRDPIQFRQVLQALREHDYRRAVEVLPLAASATVIALAFAVLASVTASADTGQTLHVAGPTSLAIALVLIRDLALLACFSFAQRSRRAEITTLLWIALLNRVIPSLLELGGLDGVAALVRPQVFETPWTALIVAAVHAAVALTLGVRAWRASLRVVSRSGDQIS